MLPVSTALLQTIIAQNDYYEYVEANGVSPEDPEYVTLKANRDSAVAAFESGLAAFVNPAA